MTLLETTAALAQSAATPTTINIAESAKLTNVRRLGVNIGTQDFWDSGQMMRQIMFRNPGFEGEQWQSILHCKYVTATSCTDDDIYTGWPANFLKGATVEFILGKAIGTFATVTSSTVANEAAGVGVTVNLSGASIAPSVGDYLVARFELPGNAQAGWWESLSSGATIATDFNDLSPNSPGKQALRVTVPAGNTATISSFTDGYAGRSFLQMNGVYTLTFRAKSTGGSNNIGVAVSRAVSAPPEVTYFSKSVALTTSWQDYSYTFSAADTGRYGSISLQFAMNGASVLLDDVALTAAADADNPTNYRNEVVATLRTLNPGTLRYMDSGTNWGSSIDNMLAVDFARERTGYSNFNNESDSIPMGLHGFLQLSEAVGAEPWYTMPTGMSVQEMSNLMDYLGGSTATVYGAKRAAMGQVAPWTSVFKTIHLEFGNEVWNTSNPGASMNDPAAYGQRASLIFATAKKSASYSANSFDLIVGGFEANPSWNQIVLANSSNYNTIDVATYIFTDFNDASSTEKIYGPMFAEPELVVDTPDGLMNQQAAVASSATVPANLAVYESNINTTSGSATQAQINAAIPSVGSGIAASLNMLLAMRDLGVNNQNLFSLTGFQFTFQGTTSTAAATSPIWGSVIDMGGQSNLQRPNFLSEQLANSAILPTMLTTSQTGANPTWNQVLSANDDVLLAGAHYVQSFAYTDGNRLNTIVFNLSRTTALPITFAGLNAPIGAATISTLTAGAITASNESGDNVRITSTSQTLQAGSKLTVPPFSMTVVSVAAPVIPIAITAITATCARSALSPGDTTSCTASVAGQGKFNSGIVWTVDQGSISSAGVYTAPATVPASGVAKVTAASTQDRTKTATFPILIAPNAVTGVKVSCNVVTVGQGQNANCTATVSGTGSFSNAYTWSLSGGSITPAGLLTAALTGTSMSVKAVSTQDPTKTATLALVLTPVINITSSAVTTTPTTVTASWTTNLAERAGVAYGVVGGTLTGTPYDGTAVTMPSYTLTGLTPGSAYTLILTSYDNTQSAKKTVTVTLPKTPAGTVSGVSVTCASPSIFEKGTTTCAAAVAGSGAFAKTVNWSVSGGTITSAGVLTAPATGSTVTVKATSTQDATKSGNFAVAVTAVLAITNPVLTTTSTTIKASWTDSLPARNGITYAVAGGSLASTSPDANATAAPGYTLTGLTPGATYNLTLTAATATQTTTKVVAVTLPQQGVNAVSLNCAASTIFQGATTTCAASVQGSGIVSQAVTLTAASGSISASGLVTAPATGTAMVVKATSVQDPTKTASYTIALTPPIVITHPVVTVTSTTIAARWTVNVSTRNGINYSTAGSSAIDTPYDSTYTMAPGYTLTGLKPGATYKLLLTSYNSSGNTKQLQTITLPLTE